MNVPALYPHVSLSLSAGLTSPDTTTRQDLQIGRIFFGIMTGAASVMSLLGFAITGHPLLLGSGIIFGVIAISALLGEGARIRPRTITPYNNPPYSSVYSSPLAVVVGSSCAPAQHAYVAPSRPGRRHTQTVAYHPPMPPVISPTTYQQRAPVGQRVSDVYLNSSPTLQVYAPPASPYSPSYPSSRASPTSIAPSAPFIEPYRESGTTGSGATARAKIGRQ